MILMKRLITIFIFNILVFSSCSIDQNEMALLYNNQILNSYNEVTDALNIFFESTNKDIIELKKSHQLAVKTTELALNNVELIEVVKNGEELKKTTIAYLNISLKILNENGLKIIYFREELDKKYNDNLIDSVNFYVLKSYDELEIITNQFDTIHKKFAEQYHINIETDTLPSE